MLFFSVCNSTMNVLDISNGAMNTPHRWKVRPGYLSTRLKIQISD
jgi:hypothetical protein